MGSARLVPWAQVLLEHLEGWVYSEPREPLALEELAVQPALRVRPVLREQKVHLELLVPRRTGRGC